MLDIKLFRENPDLIKKSLRKRQDSEKLHWVDEVVNMDNRSRKIKQRADSLRNERNNISAEINRLKKEKKPFDQLIKKAASIPQEIKEIEDEMKAINEKIIYYRMRLPNILHDSVPYGKDSSENVVVRKIGKPKEFNFELKSHGELAEALDMVDFEDAAKIAGTGFYYLKGELALLDHALQRFAIDHLMKKGFTLVETPMMMSRKAYEGVTSLADFENVMYKIENEDLYMIATSEHPLMAMNMNEVIDESKLPLMFCGISSCFRKEIGSHGVDTRGIFRVHQFNKIEQVVICKPEDSWKMHEEIQKNSEELFKALGIPFRVVNICTGDIGIIAAKKYDIEAWSPRQQKYFEVTSASNCTAYQAVRLNIRYQKKNGEREYVHSLNNTGIATSRAMVAILENFQNKDGSISIPKALQPYMNNMKVIGAKANPEAKKSVSAKKSAASRKSAKKKKAKKMKAMEKAVEPKKSVKNKPKAKARRIAIKLKKSAKEKPKSKAKARKKKKR